MFGNLSGVIEYSADCNGDGIVDYGQILDGSLADNNGNGIPDCCDDISCLAPVQWKIEDGGNGHWYRIQEGYLPWTDARDASDSLGGQLCSMETVDELNWLKAVTLEPIQKRCLLTVDGASASAEFRPVRMMNHTETGSGLRAFRLNATVITTATWKTI